MKLSLSVLFALLTICLVSCKKTDLSIQNDEVPVAKIDKKLQGCVPASLNGYWEELYASFNPFRKTFDEYGRVTMVVAPVYSLFILDSLFLGVNYEGNKVYFVNQKDLTDTVSIAEFDKQGRLKVMHESENYLFPTTEFYYAANKLASIKIFAGLNVAMEFQYDAEGNVVKYMGVHGDELYGYDFFYDLNSKIKQQFYIEYIAWSIDNNFMLAQIMGWTPDLNPVNKRINSRYFYNTSFSDSYITDHVVDSDGKLISYKMSGFQMNLSWTCRRGNEIY